MALHFLFIRNHTSLAIICISNFIVRNLSFGAGQTKAPYTMPLVAMIEEMVLMHPSSVSICGRVNWNSRRHCIIPEKSLPQMTKLGRRWTDGHNLVNYIINSCLDKSIVCVLLRLLVGHFGACCFMYLVCEKCIKEREKVTMKWK